VVEYQVGQKELVIVDTERKQTVYIFGCKDSVVQVKGKVNSIAIDKCSKTALVFEVCCQLKAPCTRIPGIGF